jgi:NADH:ubiquinone oxidoreductase subunit 2 (subunit N)
MEVLIHICNRIYWLLSTTTHWGGDVRFAYQVYPKDFFDWFERYLFIFDSLDFINSYSFLFLFPEFCLILFIFVYLCTIKNFNNFYISHLFFCFVLFVEFLLLNHIFALLLAYDFFNMMLPLFFYSCFSCDIFSIFCKLCIVIFFIIFAYSVGFEYVWKAPSYVDIFIPIYFFFFFSLFLLSAFDLFSAYLALEGISLSLYILVANTYYKRIAIEATIKYFVFGGISNGLLLFGNSIIFGLCGSLNYLEIKYLFNEKMYGTLYHTSSIQTYLSLGCFIIVFLFKIAAFPCHMWSPDVYEGA